MKTAKQARRDARRLYRLCMVGGSIDERRVRQVVSGIIDIGRPGGLTILPRFLRLVRLDRNRHLAAVESAAALPADVRTAIEAALLRKYGEGLAMSFSENPTLLGGVRIKVGSDVYDGSVKAGLAALEARF